MSRVLLVLASVVLFSFAYYAATDLDTDPDTGSVLVVLAMSAVWLAPYVWWNHCLVRNVTNAPRASKDT